MQDHVDFNGVFWMGIMCDTTSSLLNQRSLIIDNSETSIVASPWETDALQMTSTLELDIWGSHLVDVNLQRLRLLKSTSASSMNIQLEQLH